MSSSYVKVGPHQSQDFDGEKRKDSLIFMVNDKGEIRADKVTLQTLVQNQDKTPISVVRLSKEGYTEGTLTLIVDPPSPLKNSVNIPSDSSSSNESSSKSELDQCEENLIELSETSSDDNVTALLNLLTLEDEKNCMRYNIKWDHCYTSKQQNMIASKGKNVDRMILDVNMPSRNVISYNHSNQCNTSDNVNSSYNNLKENNTLVALKKEHTISKLNQPIRRNSGRPQRNSVLKNLVKNSETEQYIDVVNNYDESTFTSESSSSEDFSFDSDYSEKEVKRKKKIKRRFPSCSRNLKEGTLKKDYCNSRNAKNKQINLQNEKKLKQILYDDTRQVCSPKFKNAHSKITADGATVMATSLPPVEINVLQTKNQVKANLINSNMVGGGMILTTPGRDQYNVFKKKMSHWNVNDSHNSNSTNHEIAPKTIKIKVQASKTPQIKDIKILSTPIRLERNYKNIPKIVKDQCQILKKSNFEREEKPLEINKTKSIKEVKVKSADGTNLAVDKKITSSATIKRESRKSHTFNDEYSQPDLFSTPDIIRRVISTKELSNNSDTVTQPTSAFMVQTENESSSQESKVLTKEKPTSKKVTMLDTLTNGNKNKPEISNIIDGSLISSHPVDVQSTEQSAILGNSDVIKAVLTEEKDQLELNLSQLQDKLRKEVLYKDEAVLDVSEKHLDLNNSSKSESFLASTVVYTDSASTSDNELLKREVDPMFSTKMSLPVESQFLIEETDTSIMKEFSQSLMDHLIYTNDTNKTLEQLNFADFETLSGIHPSTEPFSVPEITPANTLRTTPFVTSVPVRNFEVVAASENILLDPMLTDGMEVFPSTETTSDFFPRITSSPIRNELEGIELSTSAAKLKTEIKTRESTDEIKVALSKKLKPTLEKSSKMPIVNMNQKQEIILPLEVPKTSNKIKSSSERACPSKATENEKFEKQSPKVEPLTISLKSVRSKRKIYHVSSKQPDMVYNVNDMKHVIDKPNPVEEEDPSKPWCICKLPAGGRFMINCDKCDEWYHVDCVGIEKSAAKSMEKHGIEWNCPICSEKKNKGKKSKSTSINRKTSVDPIRSVSNASITAGSVETPAIVYNAQMSIKKKICVQCKKKGARSNSKWCSDACIMEAQGKSSPSSKRKYKIKEKTTADSKTPRRPYKKRNSTKAINNSSYSDKDKKVDRSTKDKGTNVDLNETSNELKPEPDMRAIVRENLAELLTTRLKDAKDIILSTDEVTEIAVQIESEMFKFYKDTDKKYKTKYRSLVFNMKDARNSSLFRRIADRSLSPETLVKLRPEDMAPQELAEWRKKETEHHLEMIKKNELNELSTAKSVILKTHKGEQVIENNNSLEFMDSNQTIKETDTEFYNEEVETSFPNQSKIEIPSLDESKIDIKVLEGSIKKDHEKKNELDSKKPENENKKKRSSKSRSKSSHKRSEAKDSHRKEESKKEDESKYDKSRNHSKIDSIGKKKGHSSDRKKSHKSEKDRSRSNHRKDQRKSTRDENKTEKSKRGEKRKREDHGKTDKSKQKDEKGINENDNKIIKQNKENEMDENIDTKFSSTNGVSLYNGVKKTDKNNYKKLKRNDRETEINTFTSDEILRNMEKIHNDSKKTDFLNNKKSDKSYQDSSFCAGNNTNLALVSADHLQKNESSVKNMIDVLSMNERSIFSINSEFNNHINSATLIKSSSLGYEFRDQVFEEEKIKVETVWKGIIKQNEPEVAKIFVYAQRVSENSEKVSKVFPDTLTIGGKISSHRVWKYIDEIKNNDVHDVVVISFAPINNEEIPPYNSLYQDLDKSNKLVGVKTDNPNIKDLYLMASSASELSSMLQTFAGCRLNERNKNKIIGIAVLKRLKRTSDSALPPVTQKMCKKENHLLVENSYSLDNSTKNVNVTQNVFEPLLPSLVSLDAVNKHNNNDNKLPDSTVPIDVDQNSSLPDESTVNINVIENMLKPLPTSLVSLDAVNKHNSNNKLRDSAVPTDVIDSRANILSSPSCSSKDEEKNLLHLQHGVEKQAIESINLILAGESSSTKFVASVQKSNKPVSKDNLEFSIPMVAESVLTGPTLIDSQFIPVEISGIPIPTDFTTENDPDDYLSQDI